VQRTKTIARDHTNEYFDVQAKLISVNEAARLTGISAWTWRSWVYSGRIASVKVGTSDNVQNKNRRLLIPVKEIRRILSEGYRPRVDGREKARA
jgi:excisionase family DNA binding protein